MADATSYRGVAPATTAWAVLVAISLCHMINDIMQSMLAAIYPLLRQEFALSYWQIGLMTFAFQVTASLLQPVVGAVTDAADVIVAASDATVVSASHATGESLVLHPAKASAETKKLMVAPSRKKAA